VSFVGTVLGGVTATIAQKIGMHKIEAFFRKWLRRLPHPFSSRDRRPGYRYDLSILQGEFSLTQIWDRPYDLGIGRGPTTSNPS
jgi:hypothetical protein